MAHLIRCPETIAVASGLLRPEELAEFTGDGMLGYMWECSRDYYEKYGVPIPETFLTAKVIEFNGAIVTDDVLDQLADFIFWIYSEPETSFNHDEVTEYLDRLLREVKVTRPLEDGLRAGADVHELFEQFQTGLSAASSGQIECIDPLACFEEAIGEFKPVVLGGTATKYLNMAVNGGFCAGDVSVLLGPTGGFKTTMMIDLVCSMAEMGQYAMFLAHEQSFHSGDMQIRFLSRASGIDRTILGNTQVKNLPQEYRDKLQAAQERNSKYMLVTDRTQFEDRIPTIGRMVEYFDREGRKPQVIIIDQLIPWISKWEEIDSRPDSQRKLIQNVIIKLKREIAEKYGISVILLHQIAAAAIGKGSHGRAYHHTESAECKSISYWADIVLTVGTPDKETGVLKLCGSKVRRGPPTEILVKTIPETCNFQVATDYEEARYEGGKYVKKGEAAKIPGPKFTKPSASSVI